eukprot:c19433_g1_i1 orf=277-588(+)
MATQLGKMGTLLHARKEEVFGSVPTFNVNVVLGKRDEPTLVACARQLIEDMSNSGSSRQLLLSLGLKDHSAVRLVLVCRYSSCSGFLGFEVMTGNYHFFARRL